MIRLTLLLPCLLAACASPSAAYLGAPARLAQVNGREYRVFLSPGGTRAQVVRMGWAAGRAHRLLIHDMATAAERVSGCIALDGRSRGDSGVLNVALRCP